MRIIPLRFSLLSLMAAVSAVAVACAALRFASELWASAVLTATIGMLLAGVLGMVLRRGPARAFWFGFTLFGSAYLILALAPWCSANVRPQLLTSKLLAYVHPKLQTAPAPLLNYGTQQLAVGSDGGVVSLRVDGLLDVTTGQQVATLDSNVVNSVAFSDGGTLLAFGTGPQPQTIIWNLAITQRPAWEHFERVGYSLFGLLVALGGGLLARYVFARRSSTEVGPVAGVNCSC